MNERESRLFVAVAVLTLLLAGMLAFCARAHADEFPVIVGKEFGEGGVLCCFLPIGDGVFILSEGADTTAFVPSATENVNLGLPLRPWRNVYVRNKVSAQSFVANGAAGLNTVIHFGQCVLTIQGGLITSAVVPPDNQPCP